MNRLSRQSVWILLAGALVFLAAGQRGACSDIPGLAQVFDPAVVAGATINVSGPPSTARDRDTTHNSIESVREMMESRMASDDTYQTCRQNWPTTKQPNVTLAEIGAAVQQGYNNTVMNRVSSPAVSSVDVENLTLVYPSNYYLNPEPVAVHAKRFTLHGADGRTVVGYYTNYDKINQYNNSVVLEVNGHFGRNPSRLGLGLEGNGGATGAALGKLAMQGLPMITYDDQNVGESSSGPDGLPQTLESLQMVDRTLLKHFDRVDAVGISGGTERLFHFLGFFESKVRSAYLAGFADPTWLHVYDKVNNIVGGWNTDTYDDAFLRNYQYADMSLLGISRGVDLAFVWAAYEGGIGKWSHAEEMMPIMNRYTNKYQTRGDDTNGDGIPDYPPGLAHEYDVADFTEWLAQVRAPVPEPSGLALFGTGLLCLFAYAWRRSVKRRRWTSAAVSLTGLIVAISCIVVASASAETPNPSRCIEPGVRQLFLDDSDIESIDGLSRVVNPAVKCPENPIMRRELPIEAFAIELLGTVIHHPDVNQYQMWYLQWPAIDGPAVKIDGQNRVPWVTQVGYATSTDGIRWTKPDLGQVDFNGDSKHNNTLKIGRDNPQGIAVLYEPNDPDPSRRYKALFFEHRSGAADKYGVPPYDPPAVGRWADALWAAFSPDGVVWTTYGMVSPVSNDSNTVVLWDPKLQKYVAYGRFGFQRRTARMVSSDFIHWSVPEVVFEADAQDGPKNTEVEGFCACLYEGRYIGLPFMRYNQPDGHMTNAVQLLHSDDGIRWRRLGDRQSVLAPGEPDAWDGKVMKLAHQPVIQEDRILVYYCAFSAKHQYQIGLATLRRDGWVSLDAGEQPGTLLTKPAILPEGSLSVNADAGNGEVNVSLIDESGKLLAESKPLQGDQLCAKLEFGAGVPPPGTPVRLRFSVRNAKLYSYWVGADVPKP